MSRFRVGVIAIFMAALAALTALARSPFLAASQPVMGVLSEVVALAVGLALWRLAHREQRAGRQLLLVSFILAVAAATVSHAADITYGRTLPLPVFGLEVGFYVAVSLCLAVGLLRTRMIPGRVPWLRIVAALLYPVILVIGFVATSIRNAFALGLQQAPPSWVQLLAVVPAWLYILFRILDVLFWLFVGLALLGRLGPGRTAASPAQQADQADGHEVYASK